MSLMSAAVTTMVVVVLVAVVDLCHFWGFIWETVCVAATELGHWCSFYCEGLTLKIVSRVSLYVVLLYVVCFHSTLPVSSEVSVDSLSKTSNLVLQISTRLFFHMHPSHNAYLCVPLVLEVMWNSSRKRLLFKTNHDDGPIEWNIELFGWSWWASGRRQSPQLHQHVTLVT